MSGGAKIYNLIPSLLRKTVNWIYYFNIIKNNGFNWIYLKYNYSIKDIFLYKDEIKTTEAELKKILKFAHDAELNVSINLMINYNDNSLDDKDNWNQYLNIMTHLVKLGCNGFCCLDACKVNQNLWMYLIDNIKALNPNIQFWGETLGCSSEDTIKVAEAGFDYIFNSSKWWNFEEQSFLIEYKKIAGCAPSISFPEYYGNEKIRLDTECNINYAKIRYVFAALFSTGVMIPNEFEFGFEDNLESRPYDISDFIKIINDIKDLFNIFNEDNIIDIIFTENDNIFVFTKYSLDKTQKAMIIINKDLYNYQRCGFDNIYSIMDNKLIFDTSPYNKMKFIPQIYEYHLAPGEVRILIAK